MLDATTAKIGVPPAAEYVICADGAGKTNKNKPATFQYPGYSLSSDFILFFDLLRGKESFNPKK